MASLKKFFEEALKLEYVSGGYQESQHEFAVESLLINNGFNKSNIKKISRQEKEKALIGQTFLGLKNNEYIYQPTGKNGSPDFIVRFNGKLYFIECKTNSSSTHPVYNGGLPIPEYIYIFTSGKTNKTTIFYGEDVLKEPKRTLYTKLIEEINIILKLYQAMPEWKNDCRGFDFYIRNMYTQSGGEKKTDYFKHYERVICEKNVLNSIGG
jgi:hypothetical protein